MCPNCDAEYEVDASAIPESGRDVQCSNCGHAWFQQHPELEAEQEAESALYDPPPPLSKMGMSESILPADLDWQVESDDPEAILDAMGLEARELGAGTAPDDLPEMAPEPAPDQIDPAAPVPKHDIDPEALRILREEAEFETAQRALEQGRAGPDILGPEDPAQDNPATAAPVVARRVARLKGIQPPTPNAAQNPPKTAPSARLPKIDTVTAELRDQDLLPAKANLRPKSGRGGLFTAFTIAVAATGAYVFGPDLSALVPSLAKPLAQYVAFVDGLRDQLDAWIPQVVALVERGIVLVKGWF